MVRDRSQLVIVGGGAVGAVLLAFVLAYGQPPNRNGATNVDESHRGGAQGQSGNGHNGRDNRWPVYQRHAGEWKHWGGNWQRGGSSGRPWGTPQVSSGWFQRPYPYHLDYYKMKWGGSYAPYFGNLYGVPFGTPQVVDGGWGLGTGGWGPEGGAVPPPGYEWLEGGPNSGAAPVTGVERSPVDSDSANGNTGAAPAGAESLPAPAQ